MTSPFSDPHDAAAFSHYQQAQLAEYTQWVAAHDIRLAAGALAFAAGAPIPASTVAAQGWDKDGTALPAPRSGAQRVQQLEAMRAQRLREAQDIDEELKNLAEQDAAEGEGEGGKAKKRARRARPAPAPEGEPGEQTDGDERAGEQAGE